MKYEMRLKKLFHGVELKVEDLFLLESFQIETLQSRVPKKEFSAVLFANPIIKSFLINKHPPIAEYIKKVQDKYGPAKDEKELLVFSDRVIWEIAELIIYNKYPDVYDTRAIFQWSLKDITSVVSLKDKIIIDAGAGTGRVSFKAGKDADIVFAVEPCASLRNFIRKKAKENKITNLFVIDGFLNEIPLPNNFADVLITSNAIGWKLDDELKEVERVVKTGGYVIHLTCSQDTDDPLKHKLIKPELKYNFSEYKENKFTIRKYWKKIN
ncbi:MAG: class I SAM-dependent methyltransferase [Candidatus Thermoplasmatota archaeon]|nr:class I SAM-dependent methyltransferase [Candidatus Thermoplasmatota archaeon]